MQLFETILSSEGLPFAVQTGISDILLKQLVAASTADDVALQKFTDDPTRFSDIDKAKSWLQGERQVYVLTPGDELDRLAGFGWFREDTILHIPDVTEDEGLLGEYLATGGNGNYTVAARMYGKYRGQRLATPFLQAIHKDFMVSTRNNIASIIALIHEENIPSQKLFARLGYQFFGKKKHRLLWILNQENIQQYL